MTTNRTGKRPLPNGWTWTTIGKAAKVNYRDPTLREMPDELEVTFIPMAAVDEVDGKIANPQVKPLGKTRKGYTPFSEGDVLFAKITPCMENGKAAIARNLKNGLGFGSTEFHVMKPKVNVLAEWLFYYVRQSKFRDDAKANFSGTAGQLRVKKDFIVGSPLPLPPLPEQDRIVAEIEKQFTRLDQAVASLHRLQNNLARYKASVLKAACEGRLVPQNTNDEPAADLLARILAERRAQWQAANPGKKYKEPKGVETADLPDLPEEWVWASLDQLVAKIEAGKSPRTQNRPIEPGEVGVIKVSAMSWGEFLPEENKALLENSKPDNMPSIKVGDLLISRANTVELVGAVVLVKKDYPDLLLSDKSLRLVPVSNLIMPQYLLFALRTSWVREVFENQATGTSNSMRNLSQGKIKSAPISFPPLAEQERIVAEVERRLSVVATTEQAITTNLARAERLRQSILHRAFTGQLVLQKG